jgi:hypothetical protein
VDHGWAPGTTAGAADTSVYGGVAATAGRAPAERHRAVGGMRMPLTPWWLLHATGLVRGRWRIRVVTEAISGGTDGAPPVEDVGFLRLSEGFNRLIRRINADLGYSVVQEVQQPEADLLRVVPSKAWLINGSREAHLMAAAAIYEMWKNHQNGAPVRLVMVDDQGRDYITIIDDETGPNLSIAVPARG